MFTATIEYRGTDNRSIIRLSGTAGLDPVRHGEQASGLTQLLINALVSSPEISDAYVVAADSSEPKSNIVVCWLEGSSPLSTSQAAWKIVQQIIPEVTMKRAFWE